MSIFESNAIFFILKSRTSLLKHILYCNPFLPMFCTAIPKASLISLSKFGGYLLQANVYSIYYYFWNQTLLKPSISKHLPINHI